MCVRRAHRAIEQKKKEEYIETQRQKEGAGQWWVIGCLKLIQRERNKSHNTALHRQTELEVHNGDSGLISSVGIIVLGWSAFSELKDFIAPPPSSPEA